MKPIANVFQSIHNIFTRYPIREVIRTTLLEPRLAWAYRRRSLTVPSLPARMMIDPINLCNLECPLCPTGKHISGMTRTRMSYDLFEHIVGLNPRLRILDLFNLGEPFLNKDIFQMLALCREKKIRVAVHTNLTAYDTDLVERIIETPPTRLHISVDGICQETYGLYRVGGDFEKLRRNMEYLSKRIKETGKGPIVEWAFLYHKGNRQDIGQAESLARKLGFKFFVRPLVTPTHLGPDWHDPETLKSDAVSFKANVVCPHLWLQMTVKPTGALTTCCFAYHDQDQVDSLATLSTPEQLLELWNSAYYRRGRACFSSDATFREIPKPMLCETCNIYPRSGGLDPKKHPYDSTIRDWM
jgi:pyruvate-formate lyase-activating enzyme